ncbi:S8 family serine peptidase, partial [Bacillus sp. SIMBA_005]
APGEEILSTYLNGTYAKLSGTSMATPHISGALALIKENANRNFERNLTEAELYAQLIKRTIPLGNSPKLEGNGMLYLTTEE